VHKGHGKKCHGHPGAISQFVHKDVVAHINGFLHGRGWYHVGFHHKKSQQESHSQSNDNRFEQFGDQFSPAGNFISFPGGPGDQLKKKQVSQHQIPKQQPIIAAPTHKQRVTC